MKAILGLSGGGIRGRLQAEVLSRIEERACCPIADKFSLIAGTSTGGILACGLGLGMSAVDMARFYEKHGPSIFKKRFWSMVPILLPKYSSAGLAAALKEVLGDREMRDCQTKVMVTALNLGTNEPKFFKSFQPDDAGYYLRDVARCTSAAPTFFPAFEDHVDGGVFANNPTLNAYVEAIKLWPKDEFLVVHVGTGFHTVGLNVEKLDSAGAAQWAPALMSILMDGPMNNQEHMLEVLCAARGDAFVSLNIALPAECAKMDNASQSNIAMLATYGNKLADRRLQDMSLIESLLAKINPLNPTTPVV